MKQFHEGKLAEVELVPTGKVISGRLERGFSLLILFDFAELSVVTT
jgi:hypothetical protein